MAVLKVLIKDSQLNMQFGKLLLLAAEDAAAYRQIATPARLQHKMYRTNGLC